MARTGTASSTGTLAGTCLADPPDLEALDSSKAGGVMVVVLVEEGCLIEFTFLCATAVEDIADTY